MAVVAWGYKFEGEGQNHSADLWPVIDLNPDEWREVEECPTLPPTDAPAATHGSSAPGAGTP